MSGYIEQLSRNDKGFIHLDENLVVVNRKYEKDLFLNYLIFPGSFNPLHDGHKKLLDAAVLYTNKKPIYEISITNVAKKGKKHMIINLSFERRISLSRQWKHF